MQSPQPEQYIFFHTAVVYFFLTNSSWADWARASPSYSREMRLVKIFEGFRKFCEKNISPIASLERHPKSVTIYA